MRLAYFSPLPPQRTGIADYSVDLLKALTALCKVTLFVDDPDILSDALRDYSVAPIDTYPERRWDFDMALYQIGNSPFHSGIYATALRYPGVVVLHDYTLHHLVASMTSGKDNFSAYLREMAYARGLDGVAKAQQIAQGAEMPLFTWPLNERLVDISLGVLVHSDFVRDKLLAVHPRTRVAQIAQPMPLPPLRDRRQARSDLGLPADAFIVITSGHTTPAKCLDVVLDCFKDFHRQFPDSLWLITGESKLDAARWQKELQAANLGDSVREIGYIEGLDAFYDYLAASDVCINLRNPTAGETSASVLRALAVKTPVIVSDVGWYSELPDNVCAKITHDGTESAQLFAALETWYRDRALRSTAGESARTYVARTCDPLRVAETYVAFCEELLSA